MFSVGSAALGSLQLSGNPRRNTFWLGVVFPVEMLQLRKILVLRNDLFISRLNFVCHRAYELLEVRYKQTSIQQGDISKYFGYQGLHNFRILIHGLLHGLRVNVLAVALMELGSRQASG